MGDVPGYFKSIQSPFYAFKYAWELPVLGRKGLDRRKSLESVANSKEASQSGY